jgi:hypothetical protein
VQEARQRSSEGYNTGNDLTTGIIRGQYALDALETLVNPPSDRPLRILEVGIGYENDMFKCPNDCPYEPYRISSYLEFRGIDYQMVIVDLDERVVEDLKRRTTVYVSSNQLDTFRHRPTWEQYLCWTNQEGKSWTASVSGQSVRGNELIISDGALATGDAYEFFEAAAVPSSFRSKMDNGEVVVLQGDVATVDLSGYDPFDMVVCMNVLYQLDKDGQTLALYNMARALSIGGVLVIDNYDSEELMRELGFRVQHTFQKDRATHTVALRRFL